MRIAFASENPPNQIRYFSGIPYYMSQFIQSSADFFEYIHTPMFDLEIVLSEQEKGLSELKKIGQFLSERLREMVVDVVICQGCSMIPFLETDKLIVLWHDSTWFSLMQMGFEEFKFCYPLLYEWDRLVLEKCDLIAFAADWIRNQTLTYYNIDPDKLYVIPFGANLESLSQETIHQFIKERKRTPCKLTFIGIDWLRKGLNLAYGVMTKLNTNGLTAELNVIGSNLNSNMKLERKYENYIDYQTFNSAEMFKIQLRSDKKVNIIGFLSKDNSLQNNQLCNILKNTHFLLHPANFECFGIALAEANAFGVPVIATDNHGPQTIIKNRFNGQLFDSGEYVEQASNFIQYQMQAYENYKTLARSSFREYLERLNWSTSFQKLRELISVLLQKRNNSQNGKHY